MLERILTLLLAASWVYWLTALWLTRAFYHAHARPASSGAGGSSARAGRLASTGGFTPPVSVLKPVRGLDPGVYENFVSYCRQDYPEYEIIFGVADPADPVIAVVQRLRRDFPNVPIRLVVARPFGANRKAGMLHHLTAQARHEILVISDSDMRVTPDYLRRVVAPLADSRVGLVTCPYVGEQAQSLTAGLEALYMGTTFLPSVMVGRKAVAMRFALGASLAVRRSDLARLGGFAALSDYLAEDYQIGSRMAAAGLRVCLSNYVMRCVLGATTFREQWNREVRWSRCTRVSRPREYPTLLLTFSTPLAALLAWGSGFEPVYRQALVVSLVLRWVVGWLVTGYTGDRVSRRWLVWLPVRDLLTALVWLAAGAGKHVVWRGESYEVLPGGRIRPLGAGRPAGALDPASLGLDEGEEGEGATDLEGGGEGAGLPPTPMLRHP